MVVICDKYLSTLDSRSRPGMTGGLRFGVCGTGFYRLLDAPSRMTGVLRFVIWKLFGNWNLELGN